MLARAAIASQRLDDLAGVKRGRLRLAASQTVANYWLPAVIARFRGAHPEIALTVRIGNSDDAARAVEALQADIGIRCGWCSQAVPQGAIFRPNACGTLLGSCVKQAQARATVFCSGSDGRVWGWKIWKAR